MKSLVVFYTRTGNTKFLAEKIAEELEADIEEIIDKKKRQGKIAWLSAGRDAMKGNKTEIGEITKNPSEYELIAIGTPNWASKPTPAIRTYLGKYDLSGKKVVAFCSSDGYDSGQKVIAELKTMIPNSDSLESLVVEKPLKNKADAENNISEWCNKIKLQ
ncbi:MAG: flavodoxin [Candidatus Bathyarchaeota archaeon]|nr:flavodoxin [Candidatus Bathyarchaeota archaeon]